MKNEPVYKRFDLHQRIQHIGMFMSFFLLTLTGLPIKFEQSGFAQGVVTLFGGFENMYAAHLIGGAVMIAVSVYHLAYLVMDPIVTRKRSWAVLPKGKDVIDVVHDVQFMLGFRKNPPQFDRYSYKEKFDYWAVFWGMLIMGGSGLLMWFPGFFTQFMPRWVIDSARFAHTDEAILAIAAIFIWHFFNVHFGPKFFPMNHVWYKGTITREEMVEDHPLELQRLEQGKDSPNRQERVR